MRDVAAIDSDMLGGLLNISRQAVIKRVQRGTVPPPVKVDGRRQLWSLASVMDILPDEVRKALAPHIVLDPFEPHDVVYRGCDVDADSVLFWFEVDHEVWIGYRHPTANDSAEEPTWFGSLQLEQARDAWAVSYEASREQMKSQETFRQSEMNSLELSLTMEPLSLPDESFAHWSSLVKLNEHQASIELNMLLGFRLPWWPLNLADPETMARWRPGAPTPLPPTREEIVADALDHFGAPAGVSDDLRRIGRFDMLRGLGDHDAVAFTFDEDDTRVQQGRQALAGVRSQDPVRYDPEALYSEELMLQVPQAAALLLQGDFPGLRPFLAPEDSEPDLGPDWLPGSLVSHHMAKIIGLPAELLLWGRGQDGSLWMRRPGGRWWRTPAVPELVGKTTQDVFG